MINYFFIIVLFANLVTGQFGPYEQDFGYVTVREGCHMFYWLFYTTASVNTYNERPLIVWLQGGPGGSSTGIGNFEILGPIDLLTLQERNHTWIKNFNVIFLDNPVGTGFSYVDDMSFLTKTNDEIAQDFVKFMGGFYEKHPEFERVPLYVFGQSYGGKMVVDMAIRMVEAESNQAIRSNLRGIGMGNSWITPVSMTLSWAPLLLAASLVDEEGYHAIQESAREAERLYNEKLYLNSTLQWGQTQGVVFERTNNVDWYNIMNKMNPNYRARRTDNEITRDMVLDIKQYKFSSRNYVDIDEFMNTQVKEALNIPDHVRWESVNMNVFNTLREDFMKPVTDGIEKLLNETDLIITKYNGNVDLICCTPGQIEWVDQLRWPGAEGYRNSPRRAIWEAGKLEGYYKSFGNFRFFWINSAGHSAPADNPAATAALLRDMTTFG